MRTAFLNRAHLTFRQAGTVKFYQKGQGRYGVISARLAGASGLIISL